MTFIEILIASLLLLLALLVVWCFGYKWGRRQQQADNAPLSKSNYFRGLNFLINEEPDESIDTFINSLEVTTETLETHLAMGSLMRRRGEVERAIRIHQNLLSHAGLSRNQLCQVQLELARDFMQAGLLDRAERLMLDLTEMSDQYRKTALQYLLEIYRDEQEWQKAIGVADKLWPRRLLFSVGSGGLERGHFCCELAEHALRHGELLEARRQLKQALKCDKNSVRASLLLAEIDIQQGSHSDALKRLEKIPSQDIALLPEAVPLICKVYQQQNREHELLDYLTRLLEQYPSNSLVMAIAERLFYGKGKADAVAFLRQRLDKATALPGLLQLLAWESPVDGERRDSYSLTITALQQQLSERNNYRCYDCGFLTQNMHWLCPACKHWGAVKPLKEK